MTALNRVPSLMARAGTASAFAIAAVGGSVVVPGVASDAAAATPATKALQIAASKKGAPYRYGATGPKRFDCSGLTLYSFKKAGKKLPRTAAQQYNKTRHISASQRQAANPQRLLDRSPAPALLPASCLAVPGWSTRWGCGHAVGGGA